MDNIFQITDGNTISGYRIILKDLADRIKIDITPFRIFITCYTYDNKEVIYKFETPEIYWMSYNSIETMVTKWVDDKPMSNTHAIVNMIAKAYITAAIYDYAKRDHNINDDVIDNSIYVYMNDNMMIEASSSLLPKSCPKYWIDPMKAMTNNYITNNDDISNYVDNIVGDNIPDKLKGKFKNAISNKLNEYIARLITKVDGLFKTEVKYTK
jgi:hypothetical protein